MFGTRAVAGILHKSGSLCKSAVLQKAWNGSFSSSTRALSNMKTPFEPQSKSITDSNLINKRFYQGGSSGSSSSSQTLSSKLFAAFGVLFGIGTGAAYNAIVDEKDKIPLGNQFFVACAEKCGCPKKDCVEKKCEDSPCLRKLECEEELIIRANSDLEKALKDTKGKAVEYTEKAMKAYCEAIALICEFLNHGYCVIDNDELVTPQYEESWCCVYDIAKKRCAKVRDALEKGQCAWELLCRLREIIENGKACKYTACNPLLITAEDALICAEKELLTLKAKMDCVASEHDMVDQYKDVIQSFRADLKSEVEKQIAAMECCEIKYAEQEMALMILEGYRRAVRAQKEMAQQMICKGKIPDRLKCTCC